MKLVIFYISDHGFGHAARNIPIIKELLATDEKLRVIVRTGSAQGEFIQSNFLGESRLSVIKESLDVGLVLQPMSFELDVPTLEERIKQYIESWEQRIEREEQFLTHEQPDLIVSDIVPWVFHAAKQANITSVLISNFTWVDIYEEYLSAELVKAYQDCYALADEVFMYELSGSKMKERFVKYDEVSLCARGFDLTAVAEIRSGYEKPLVFISVGRSVDLAEQIDVSNEPYHFIVTEGIQLVGENVTYLAKETPNTHDYVCASEFVITKAGFGTVAEALLAKKKIAVIERDSIAEDRATVEWLVSHGLALPIQYEKGLHLSQLLKDLKQWTPDYEAVNLSNDANKIANRLLLLMKQSAGHHLMSLATYGKEEMGYLVPLDEDIPFEVKRFFYLTDVPKEVSRGRHAYHETKQVLICVSGNVKVKCREGEREVIYHLRNNKQGLYLEPHVWREAYDFSEDAVLFVLSSKEYNEEDYRR